MLDPPDQVLIGRVVLVDDRRALAPAIVDDDIDLVAAEPHLRRRAFRGRRRRRALGLLPLRRGRRRRRQEVVDVLLDVPLDRVEILEHIGEIAIPGPRLANQAGDGETGGLAIELARRLAVLALPLRHLAHDGFELALRRGEVGLDALALVLGQRVEILALHDLAVALRR